MTAAVRRFEVSHMIGDGGIDPAEQLLAKRCVIRHSRSTAETFELIAMLGLHQIPEPAREPERMIASRLRYQRARSTKGRHA